MLFLTKKQALSHLKERKEKNCLNCNAQVYGKYCHVCGQENIEPKESVWHLVNHFFQDITHFDGKFFSTVKLLVFKPGFLSREYMAGRRMSYLNPIRMYIFTSAFFFLIFFSLMHFDTDKTPEKKTFAKAMKTLQRKEKEAKDELAVAKDSMEVKELQRYINDVQGDIETLRKDSTAYDKLKTRVYTNGFNIYSGNYKTVAEYDSAENALPEKDRDNWLGRIIMRRALAVKEKYKNASFQNVLLAKFIHSFPQILFISLPLFALLLKMLYSRRKQFYYVNHGIFSVHLYIFCFITFLAMIGVSEAEDWLGWNWLTVLNAILGIGIFFYLYKAMRNFYQQRRAKTIFKFILLCLSAFIMLSILFLFFFIFSFFQI